MTRTGAPVRVLLFGYYRELAGRSEMQLDLPAGSRVEDLVAAIRSNPPFVDLPPTAAVAVNRRYAQSSQRLSAGDERALSPPMSGG